MARRLLLIRHAKAEQNAASDIERELSGRGRRDAKAAGGWLVSRGFLPNRVVVSDAARAVQTWEAIATAIEVEPEVVTDARLYDNTVEALFAVIADAPASAGTLALVGHNPSIHGVAMSLDDGDGQPASTTQMATSYPTMGIAVFDVEVPWSAIRPGSGRLVAFEAPRA